MSFTKEKWFGRPEPIIDETLSSWFRRCAEANRLTPQELYRVVMPGAQLFSYDLDRYACDTFIDEIAGSTGNVPNRIRNMALTRWCPAVIPQIHGRGKLRWLPPVGRDGSRKSFGQQICRSCLREDTTPYLRTHWRLSFNLLCNIHNRYLIDRCPSCAEPIQVLATKNNKQQLTQCWNCNIDFRGDEYPKAPPAHTIKTHDYMTNILNIGWAQLGTYHLAYSFIYFDILDSLFRLLANGRHAISLRSAVAEELKHSSLPISNIPRLKEYERYNPRCRGEILTMAAHLLTDWPHRFISIFRQAGIPSGALLKGNRALPFAFECTIQQHLSGAIDIASPEEVEQAAIILSLRGEVPTRSALQEILGKKFASDSACTQPGRSCLPYGTHRYWKLDGVSPEIRKAAKVAAKLDGENVGAWVNKTLERALTNNSINLRLV